MCVCVNDPARGSKSRAAARGSRGDCLDHIRICKLYSPPAMSNLAYAMGKALCRTIAFLTLRRVILHRERFDSLPGGFILACTHLSHLEPIIVSTLVGRQIDWISRLEFYRYHVIAAALRALDAIPLNRQRATHSSFRTAIQRMREGRIVGIFPEGGVALGPDSVLHGGPIKHGVCLLAQRSGRPIVPVVVVGTEHLNRIAPWLPFRHARVRLIFGRPIFPKFQEPKRRVAREQLGEELRQEFQEIYRELRTRCDSAVGRDETK
jgi:1-acyl-sn-glycerol-3-phosphate acyltransferase